MSYSINTKGISKSREDLIQEHLKQSISNQLLPAAFLYFNPLKFAAVRIGDLDMFTPASLSVLYVRSITAPNISEGSLSTIIEDSHGDACKLILGFPAYVSLGSMLAILEPVLAMKNGTGAVEINNPQDISVFNDEQEFRNAGWGQAMPPGFGTDHYLAQAAVLLEKKQYKEALRKYSIAMNNDPSNLDVLSGLISCYMSLGDMDNALAISKRALEISPGNVKVVKMCAKCLVECNRYQEAKALIDNSRANDIDIDNFVGKNCTKRMPKCNRTRLSRLKELVLVEWPKLVSIEKIKKKLSDEGIHADRVSIRGKTAILIYDSVEKREGARKMMLSLEDSEFMLANEPAIYD